uniref:GIPC1-3 GH1 domain-containing protein n=1 Tax=Plectus sambesii TaxID=2011161 RepID=A0A914WW22_9BILA
MAEQLNEKAIGDEGAAAQPLPDVLAGHHSRSPRRRSRSRRRSSAKAMARASSGIKMAEQPTKATEKKLTFQCQLAHGSPTGLISGFNRLSQLYQAIADCY